MPAQSSGLPANVGIASARACAATFIASATAASSAAFAAAAAFASSAAVPPPQSPHVAAQCFCMNCVAHASFVDRRWMPTQSR